MRKQVITQEMILDAALEVTREQGFECVNARSVADFMGRSVQPIYSYFQNMEELKDALHKKAMVFYAAFIHAHADMLSLESMGKVNIQFAKREPNLFRLLYLTKRNDFHSFLDIFDTMSNSAATQILADKHGISNESAEQIYIMMIVFTHGIATMLATGAADIGEDEIGELLSQAYLSFVGRKLGNCN